MKHFLLRALALLLFTAGMNTLYAQTDRGRLSTSPSATTVIDGDTQPQVTKEFISDLDHIDIDIVKGPIEYKLFVNSKKNPSRWTQVAGDTVDQPKDPSTSTDVQLDQPDSYQVKLVLALPCDTCASVAFSSGKK